MTSIGAIPAEYCTFDERPFRWRMGLRPLDLDHWIEIDAHRSEALDHKARLLERRRDAVVAARPGSMAAAAEVETALRDHLGPRVGPLPPIDPSLHPIDGAGRLVQEDLLLMQRSDDEWRLTAGSLCFPTNWALTDKLGLSLAAIHAPVPDYQAQLGSAVESFFDRLRVGSPVWRANWTVTDDPSLRLEAEQRVRPHRDIGADDVADHLHLRVERQTLRAFPVHGAILFTVRIHRRPIADLADRPDLARRLAAAVGGLPSAVGAYKDSTSRWAGPLVEWLETVASAD